MGGRCRRQVALALALFGWTGIASADEIRVAVASNFAATLEELVQEFESKTEDRVLVSVGSTGKLYAQIINGAPFEIFLAADASRPRLLEENGSAVAGSRFTYALGRLALWSRDPDLIDGTRHVLEEGGFRHLALANPRTAPYGSAAVMVLERLELWKTTEPHLVFGENVAQAFSFVSTGNAELGFVALALVDRLDAGDRGSSWIVPSELHLPIEQQGVLLEGGRENPAALRFISFLHSPAAREIVARAGYEVE